MTFADWREETIQRVDERGIAGVRESIRELYVGFHRRLGRIWNYGTPIYEEDWDVLVVLDACRADVMETVLDDYPSLVRGGSTYSVGSASPEWLEKNFDPEQYGEEMTRTAYVTGNAFSEEKLDEKDFLLLDEVWKYEWDDEVGTMRPEILTDRAIRVMRETKPDRMVVHYMQPHQPYLGNPVTGDGIDPHDVGNPGDTSFDKLKRGEIEESEVRRWYRENLEIVLENIENVLLENLDAETVVITADHGELFGEYGLYAHPRDTLVPLLKRVPWVHAEAHDTGEYEPTIKADRTADIDVRNRLDDLGYL
ncbi:sulfatase-like hydrolase/transferase [Halalkalicoccus jeotgali]|uniref:Sulfatase N-terminal domain-containing protein n=1 Tax=Halalkalicoccus jeotgali (strain DSM 18796 / CECT 7217 / JCM 14584 / KCTC 4019 / B3) TaxID=795797 RepID=D8J4N9_HALJB|nr:sulfatase-like hydrolase/transferase [Halalkalicoccus jeotgali]ADJ15506.1 hypothetical protein HacjB3_10615 [Halalkalicoccus jeotgali B3]ELY36085.1 hypothetical protein C497_12052 [Halalkalicoccus jeotgali B3]